MTTVEVFTIFTKLKLADELMFVVAFAQLVPVQPEPAAGGVPPETVATEA